MQKQKHLQACLEIKYGQLPKRIEYVLEWNLDNPSV